MYVRTFDSALNVNYTRAALIYKSFIYGCTAYIEKMLVKVD